MAQEFGRFAKAATRLAILAAAVLLGAILLGVARNSLWLDETITMGLAYNAPAGFWRWLDLLSTAADPHFPTIYVVTRLVSGMVAWMGLPLQVFVRLPLILLLAGSLVLVVRLCLADADRVRGSLLALSVLLVLVSDPNWPEHSAEARMYGLMTTTAIAAVLATLRDRFLLAAWLGLGLVALHPFGLMLGLAPVCVVLVFRRRAVTWGQYIALAIATAVLLGLVTYWCIQKFGLGRSADFAAHGRPEAILAVLAGLSRPSLVAAPLLLAMAGAVAWRRDPAALPRLGALAIVLVSLFGFLGGLLILRPQSPPYPRYVHWVNPALVTIGLVALISMLSGSRFVLPFRVRGLVATGLAVAVVILAVARPFGPPWGDGLREAADYLNRAVTQGDAVASDTFEMVYIAPRYRRGLRCECGAQITGYLTPEVQARIPCQVADLVSFGPEVQRVFVVREPLAWVGPRKLALEKFERSDTLRFKNVVVEVFDRRDR